jgi:hypothetical protein
LPSQRRDHHAVDSILDTAAILLDEVGIQAFNPNLLSARCGFSTELSVVIKGPELVPARLRNIYIGGQAAKKAASSDTTIGARRPGMGQRSPCACSTCVASSQFLGRFFENLFGNGKGDFGLFRFAKALL